jgi:hypothetical protein
MPDGFPDLSAVLGRAKEEQATADAPKGPALWRSSKAWNEADIQPRPWIAKGYLLRGSVSLLAGAGSAGKSSLNKAWSVALAIGTPFGRFNPIKPCTVLSYNVEDDIDEERMRLSAILRWFGATPEDIEDKIHIVGPNDIGTLVVRDPDTGQLKTTAAMDELDAMIRELKPDVVLLDPLVELHTVEENDNTGLRSVIAQFRSLAKRHNIALGLAHHTRKGATIPGDPDAIRGAGSIVGAVRVAFTVCTMSGEEADKLGIADTARKHYFRVDGAKANYAALDDAEWFEKVPYRLDNGEDVVAAVPWKPPSDVVNSTVLETIKAAVAAGINGEPFTFAITRQAGERSIKALCEKHDITTKAGHGTVVAALKSAGFVSAQFKRKNRSAAQGIRAPEEYTQNVQWLDDGDE